MNKLVDTLTHLNRREQTMILGIAIVVMLYLLWMVVIGPLEHKRTRLLTTNTATEQSLGRVQLMARQIENLGQQTSQAAAGQDSISGLIDSTLRENGLAMSNFTPGGGGEVRVRIDKAGSDALMQWLYDLEVKHQVAIRELSITATNDSGQVAVNIRLLKP